MPAQQKFTLGTAIKITTVLSLDNPSAVTISIMDATNAYKITNIDMTKDTPNVYSYIYQTVDTDTYGIYCVIIKATYGAYTGRSEQVFEIEPQYLLNKDF